MEAAAPTPNPRPIPPLGAPPRNQFIASPGYDRLFFIFSPVVALLVAEAMDPLRWPFELTSFLGAELPRVTFFVAVWTYAHVFATVFRSYGNPSVFRQFRKRLLFFPVLTFTALMSSDWIFTTVILLNMLWDTYHGAMQTFGFMRIYEAKAGNDPNRGRRLDYWMSIYAYAVPYVCGLGFIGVTEAVNGFVLGSTEIPSQWRYVLEPGAPFLLAGFGLSGALLTAYYVHWHRREIQSGAALSTQKMWVVASTATVSVVAWLFRPAIEAFFIVNLFHLAQYFAMLWHTDKDSIRRSFGLGGFAIASGVLFVPFVAVSIGAGILYEASQIHQGIRWAACLAAVLTMMHFYYDGFIWSVRKSEV